MTTRTLGVGIIGAGAATQGIHLPVLAGLQDLFHVAHISDGHTGRAQQLAAPLDCAWSSDWTQLVGDPNVDVVAVASPNRVHAPQVTAACQVGKRAVLCEKPLATSAAEATDLARVSHLSGVPVIVGTMHAYDPAYLAALDHLPNLPATRGIVRSTMYLASNGAFLDTATQMIGAQAPPPPLANRDDLPGRKAALRALLTGLTAHHAPLLLALGPCEEPVLAAVLLEPMGYAVTLATEQRSVQLSAVLGGTWRPSWRFEAWTADATLTVRFPPPFLLAGSAEATVRTSGRASTWRHPRNGYENQWLHVAAAAHQRLEDPAAGAHRAAAEMRLLERIVRQAWAIIESSPP